MAKVKVFVLANLTPKPTLGYDKDLVTLTLKFDLLLKKFNLGHVFLRRRGRAVIFHMYIPCDKALHTVSKYLTLKFDLHVCTYENLQPGHNF